MIQNINKYNFTKKLELGGNKVIRTRQHAFVEVFCKLFTFRVLLLTIVYHKPPARACCFNKHNAQLAVVYNQVHINIALLVCKHLSQNEVQIRQGN